MKYIDKNGDSAFQKRGYALDGAWNFQDGVAFVALSGAGYKLLKKDGTLISIPNGVEPQEFHDGLALGHDSTGFFFIRKDGTIAFRLNVAEAHAVTLNSFNHLEMVRRGWRGQRQI